MKFRHRPDAEETRTSVVTLVHLLLENRSAAISNKHLRELLSVLLWKYTEADGKYRTRYRSAEALTCGDLAQLRHEHVFPRASLIDQLLRADAQTREAILNRAVACTVTKQEHLRLTVFDKSHLGWERYRQAGVAVRDLVTGEFVVQPAS